MLRKFCILYICLNLLNQINSENVLQRKNRAKVFHKYNMEHDTSVNYGNLKADEQIKPFVEEFTPSGSHPVPVMEQYKSVPAPKYGFIPPGHRRYNNMQVPAGRGNNRPPFGQFVPPGHRNRYPPPRTQFDSLENDSPFCDPSNGYGSSEESYENFPPFFPSYPKPSGGMPLYPTFPQPKPPPSPPRGGMSNERFPIPVSPVTIRTPKPSSTISTTTTIHPIDIDVRFGESDVKSTSAPSTSKSTYRRSAGGFDDDRIIFPSSKQLHSENDPNRSVAFRSSYEEYDDHIIFPSTKRRKRESKFRSKSLLRSSEKIEINKLNALTRKRRHLYSRECGRIINDEIQPLGVDSKNLSSSKLTPWMAAVGIKCNGAEIKWVCGGTLISKKIVLTAAHCLQRKVFCVRLGELDFSTTLENAAPIDVRVRRQVVHPEYFHGILYNDIGAVILKRAVPFHEFIQPICLPPSSTMSTDSFSQDDHDGDFVIVTGWGQQHRGGPRNDILRKIKLQIYNNTYCNKFFSKANINKTNIPEGIITSQLCAGSPIGGDSACGGDSGGPLVIKKRDRYTVIGIVSSGIGCGHKNYPEIFTRVGMYLDWIGELLYHYD